MSIIAEVRTHTEAAREQLQLATTMFAGGHQEDGLRALAAADEELEKAKALAFRPIHLANRDVTITRTATGAFVDGPTGRAEIYIRPNFANLERTFFVYLPATDPANPPLTGSDGRGYEPGVHYETYSAAVAAAVKAVS